MNDRRCRYQQSLSRVLGVGVLTLLALASSTLARIEVNVTRIGFPTLGSGQVYRVGDWTPIIVDVDLLDQSSFDGTIRAYQYDLDGDQAFDSAEVHLSADTGGSARRFLYVLGNPMRGDGRMSIELIDSEGESVEVVSQGVPTYKPEPAEQPVSIREEEILILSVSTHAVGRVAELAETDRRTLYYPQIHVAHVSPGELPGLALGLQAVDFVVWDDADPTDLTIRQREALLEWVRHGGTLLMAAARTAGVLEESTFAKYLPVTLGDTTQVEILPIVRRHLLGPPKQEGDILGVRRRLNELEWYDQPLPAPVVLVESELRPSARLLSGEPMPVDSDDPNGKPKIKDLPIVSERWVGQGRLIFCGITLKDLLSGPDGAVEFFEKVFYLTKETNADAGPPQPLSLFGSVVASISFSTSSNVYLFLAILFSIAYLITATGGTWWYLGRYRRRQHAWSAFAVVAGCASILSLGAVGWARGIGDRIHQLSIIDLDAGANDAEGVAFFGIKTALDQELDFWLPPDAQTALEPASEACMLKPIPPSTDPADMQSGFADPEAYQLVPATAGIDGVRIRSTLKRLEGRWNGTLPGRVEGLIVMNRDGTLSEESYVRNELGVELKDCYLIHAQLDPFDARRGSLAPFPRDSAINTYPIEKIESGTRTNLAPLCNPKPDPNRPGMKTPTPRLKERHVSWSRPLAPTLQVDFGGSESDFQLGQERNALLIASTVGDFDPTSLQGVGYFGYGRWICSRDRLRSIDLRDRLRRETAILVGFADDAGPIRLFRRSGKSYRPMEPEKDHATTMYRIRIPVVWPDGVGKEQAAEEPES